MRRDMTIKCTRKQKEMLLIALAAHPVCVIGGNKDFCNALPSLDGTGCRECLDKVIHWKLKDKTR